MSMESMISLKVPAMQKSTEQNLETRGCISNLSCKTDSDKELLLYAEKSYALVEDHEGSKIPRSYDTAETLIPFTQKSFQ